MNHRLDKIITPKGKTRWGLRVWGRAQGDVRRRVDSRAEALKIAEELYRAEKKSERNPDNPLFREEYEYWFMTRASGFAPGWLKNVRAYWSELESEIATTRISDLTKPKLKEIEAWLKAKGNSQKTINQKIGFIVSVLNYSLKMDRLKSHKLTGFEKTKSTREEIIYWQMEEVQSFLKFADEKYRCHNRWVYCVYLTALNTAMRASEIWGLRFESLRPQAGEIHVKEQFDIASQTFRTLKGKEDRFAPLSEALYCELIELSKDRSSRDLIFHHENKPICHRAFQRRFERDLKKWAGQAITFHSLRHTSATLMLSSGVNVRTVQEILGHKSLTTTMRYVHCLREGVRNVAKTFSLTPVTPVSEK